MMKAETKAKRRAVLSFTGLSMLDATETETISDARPANVDEHGVISPQRPELPEAGRQWDSWEQWAENLDASTPAEFNAILNSLGEEAHPNQKNWLVHVAHLRGCQFDRRMLRFLGTYGVNAFRAGQGIRARYPRMLRSARNAGVPWRWRTRPTAARVRACCWATSSPR